MRVSDMPIAFLALLLLLMSIYPFSSTISYLNVHVGRAVSGSSDYWSTSFFAGICFFVFNTSLGIVTTMCPFSLIWAT